MFANSQRPPETRLDFRWDDLRIFLATLRAGTFSGAAKTLGVEVSTASRRIAALEETLGARLFDRTPDGLLPTVVAERLRPAAERTEEAALEAARAIDAVERKATGLVRLTCAPGVAEHFVAPLLVALVKRHPGLRVQLDARTGVADLMRNEADLAIRTVRPQGGDLVMQRLAEARSVVVASAAQAKAAGVVKAPGELPWIAWPREFSMIPAARWLSKVAPMAEPVLVSNAIGAHLTAAASGLGFAVVAEQFLEVQPRLVSVKLHPTVLAENPLPVEELWLVGHRALREVPRVAATWDFLVEHFRRAK